MSNQKMAGKPPGMMGNAALNLGSEQDIPDRDGHTFLSYTKPVFLVNLQKTPLCVIIIKYANM